jgi:hypothetical protein
MAEKRETLTSPVLELVYPKISKADTYGDKADGKFKTLAKLTGSPNGEQFKKVIEAKAKELMPKVKKPKLPFWTNDEGEVFLRASSKYRPLVQDAQANEVPPESVENLNIGGGTRARLKLGVNIFEGRLSLYLNGVQIAKLVQFVPKASGFGDAIEDEGEGFTFEKPLAKTEDDEETGALNDEDPDSDYDL